MVMSYEPGDSKVCTLKIGAERREHRRVEMEHRTLSVQKWEGPSRISPDFGTIIDLSAGGLRIRTGQKNIKPDTQIRLKLQLPEHAGISPFIDATDGDLKPKREWVGWMTIARVIKLDSGDCEVAGPLVDMDDMDRGMLGLYLSTQPIAA